MHMLIQKLCVNSRHCSTNIHMLFIYQVPNSVQLKASIIDTGDSPPVYCLPYHKEPPLTFPLTTEPSSQDVTPCDPASLYPLNFSRTSLAQKQRQDQWLSPLYHYLVADCADSELAHLSKNDQTWVKSTAARCKIIDDLITYMLMCSWMTQLTTVF